VVTLPKLLSTPKIAFEDSKVQENTFVKLIHGLKEYIVCYLYNLVRNQNSHRNHFDLGKVANLYDQLELEICEGKS